MILLAVFFTIVVSSCMRAAGQYTCSDDAGLMLCLRAQDRTNWLIEKTNDTMPPLFLNCSQHVIADDWKWQSSLKDNVEYSTYNNGVCYRAMKIFDGLVKKHSLNNTLPIECETIEGSKDYSATSNGASALLVCSLATFFAVLMHAI